MKRGEDDQPLREYYDRRAWGYEAIYRRDDPVRQSEQAAIAAAMKERLEGRDVLEIACGTGFWTQVIADTARHVVAVDASPEMLAVARQKGLPSGKVVFRHADAYALEKIPGAFDAGVANFWLSHIPRARMTDFLTGFHKRLGTGAVVFMADNVYVPGMGGVLLAPPGSEDTFKLRQLSDGSTHRILKNYYDARTLRGLVEPWARDLKVSAGNCFWWITYAVR